MNTPAPQLTLREWRAHLTQPGRAAGLLGAIAILTLMGPFNTDDVMRTLPRFAYWAVLVVLSYSAGYFANLTADRWITPNSSRSTLKRIALAGPLTALGVLSIVYLLNGAALGFWATGTDLALLATNVAVISIIIAAVFQIAYASDEIAPDTAQQPALFDRITFDKRAPLVSISVEDHYVRIRTTRGEDMVLLRLADAIRETAPTVGLHVHRSHWVALDQITAVTRKGDGAILSLTTGPDIPVSRANIPKLKEAGLLPR